MASVNEHISLSIQMQFAASSFLFADAHMDSVKGQFSCDAPESLQMHFSVSSVLPCEAQSACVIWQFRDV
jgi:hypothetical protein